MNIITIKNLQFRWQNNQPCILDIPDFRVSKGERVFLAGESGSGKSSLLNLLGGLTSPQSGSIEILSTDITTLSASRRDQFRADNIGFIFQQFNLVPYLSVMENVLLSCQFSGKRNTRIKDVKDEARRILDALQVPKERIEDGDVMQLSVGQQQRVAAARALIGRPPLLIADEPTSALDYNTREAFIELLFDECDKAATSVLFVSHDKSLAGMFSRQVNMHEINQAHIGRQ